MADRIVAVGLLSEGDMRRLGGSFRRYFPIEQDDAFADLIAKLDMIPEVCKKRRGETQDKDSP